MKESKEEILNSWLIETGEIEENPVAYPDQGCPQCGGKASYDGECYNGCN